MTRRGGAAEAAVAAAAAAAWQRGGRERRHRHPARRWGTGRAAREPSPPREAQRGRGGSCPAVAGQEGMAGAALGPLPGHRGTGRRWPVLPERGPGGAPAPGQPGWPMSGAGSAAPERLSAPWVKGLCPTGSACHRRLLAPRWSRGRSGPSPSRVRILPCAACYVYLTRLRVGFPQRGRGRFC